MEFLVPSDQRKSRYKGRAQISCWIVFILVFEKIFVNNRVLCFITISLSLIVVSLLTLACLDHVSNPRNNFRRPIWNFPEELHFTLLTPSKCRKRQFIYLKKSHKFHECLILQRFPFRINILYSGTEKMCGL